MPKAKKVKVVKEEKTSVPTKPVAPMPIVKSNQTLMIAALVLLVIVGLGGGYYAYKIWRPAVNSNVVTTNTAQNENTNVVLANTVNVNDTTNTSSNTNVANVTTPLPKGGESVTWMVPKKIVDQKLLGKMDNLDTENSPPAYYQIGTIDSGTYAGGKLVMVQFYYNDGPQFSPTTEYYSVNGAKSTLLVKPTTVDLVSQYNTLDNILTNYKTRGLTLDSITTLSGLFAPAVIVGPKAGELLVRDSTPVDFFDTTGLSVLFTDPIYGPVYTNLTIASTNANVEMMRQVDINKRYGFYLKRADGLIAVYQLKFDFVTYDDTVGHGPYGGGILQATWTNGKKNTLQYTTTLRTGCGSINYTDVVSPSDVSLTKDLTQVGTTDTGLNIYGYKDSNAKDLKDWYTNSYSATYYSDTNTSKKSYADFAADHPIVFVVDAFGRLDRLTNNTYQIQAECGKPVIYLYPKTTTNVDVKLQPQGGFTYTEPKYNNGWNVTAEPNGKLTERATGNVYPYLFWEGRGGIYNEPTQGFMVAQADVNSFLTTKLSQLGLNQKETADFMEFWVPKMQGSPFYKVSFLGNRSMDEIAPLSVTPKPDTIIRILMDFRPLAKPMNIAQQIIRTPQRNGFTVVEWGGVLR